MALRTLSGRAQKKKNLMRARKKTPSSLKGGTYWKKRGFASTENKVGWGGKRGGGRKFLPGGKKELFSCIDPVSECVVQKRKNS